MTLPWSCGFDPQTMGHFLLCPVDRHKFMEASEGGFGVDFISIANNGVIQLVSSFILVSSTVHR